MYTDGVSEAMNPLGKTYGSQRLLHTIENGSCEAGELCQRVLSDVAAFTQDCPQSDDICLICFTRKGQ